MKNLNAQIINLTPHLINIYRDGEIILTIPSSGTARAMEGKDKEVCSINGIPVIKKTYSEPENLPEFHENVFYVVSALTAQSAKDCGRATEDLLLTGNLVRDESGRVIGCEALCVFE